MSRSIEGRILILANVRNGIPLVPYPDGLTYFLSTHAHRPVYYGENAMPLHAVAHLLRGGIVEVVDASARKPYPDALVAGVGTWALTFGRALNKYGTPFSEVPWATRAMIQACWSDAHAHTVRAIRRLATVYGVPDRPLRVTCWPHPLRWGGKSISPEFPLRGPAIIVSAPDRAGWDDRPDDIRAMMEDSKPDA